MPTTKTKKWIVTVVIEERDDCEPFDDAESIADFVTWKIRDGAVMDVLTAWAKEKHG
jgi:hypothetical protein